LGEDGHHQGGNGEVKKGRERDAEVLRRRAPFGAQKKNPPKKNGRAAVREGPVKTVKKRGYNAHGVSSRKHGQEQRLIKSKWGKECGGKQRGKEGA